MDASYDRRVAFGGRFSRSVVSGSLARVNPLFLCGLKLPCCFRFAMRVLYGRVLATVRQENREKVFRQRGTESLAQAAQTQ